MNILIVKLSSLGDVVHAMPAVQDVRRALPHAVIDWVVERGFAPLVERCEGVRHAVPCEIRRWRKAPLSRETRSAWRTFRETLQSHTYDAVIDLQGLTKSALVARIARLAPGGKRYALGNRTEGSSYEAPTRWAADVAVRIAPHVHAVQRSRELCARALGYELQEPMRFGLNASAGAGAGADTASLGDHNAIAFVHGSSRADKGWPEASWIALGRQLADESARIVLPQGSDEEEAAAWRIAQGIGARAQVWPRMKLDALADRLAACSGAIGVDSGISHMAVALDLPHVQLYNFDTAWRTGPHTVRQVSVYAQPHPPLDAVVRAWRSAAR